MLSKNKIECIRRQFPILKIKVYGKKLIYFDNAATTQKPILLIKNIKKYYTKINSNVHRGEYKLSQLATEEMEKSRKKIQNFIHALYSHEIIFTKGTTDSINIVAFGIKNFIYKNDEIIISYLEHHSNIVPWQIICKEKGALLKIIPIDKKGCLKLNVFKKKLSNKTKIVSLTHISNVLGVINPIKKIIKMAHKYGALVLIDGTQAVSHIPVNVQDIDVDFYVFSAHKMYGPTGIGVLYGKKFLLEKLSPSQGGGEMIKEVNFNKTIYSNLPFKFEAGTPNIEGIIASRYAIKFIENIGIKKIKDYEDYLLFYATKKLSNIKGITIYAKKIPRSGILSFNLKKLHSFDVGNILDRLGIAVRTGHHCSQPLIKLFNIYGTIRISFAIYNTIEEIDFFYKAILKVKKIFSY